MGYFLILILISLLPLKTFSKIEIEGNKVFSKEEIIQDINPSFLLNLTDETIEQTSRKILDLYKNAGYIEARIKFKTQDNTLIINISEGRKFLVDNIEVKGNKFIKGEIVRKLSCLEKNRVFRVRDFENGINKIIDFYTNSGFPFIRILPSYFKTENEKIDIGIDIEEGPRLKWGGVTVQGNTITKDYVVEKQLRIPKGYYFSEKQLSISRAWLAQLSFVEPENEFGLIKGEKSGTIDVLVKIKELKSNRLNGIIGYIPSRENERGGFTGSVMTEMLNLFGTGRALSVRWEKQIPLYTRLALSYIEPWVFGTSSNLKLTFFHLLDDTLYTFSKGDIGVKIDLSLNLSFEVLTGMEKFTPATIELPPSRKYFLGTRIAFSTLDYSLNPRKGINYNFYTEYGKKTSTNVMKFTLDLNNVIPVFLNNAITILLSGKATRTNNPPLPEYEQFTLGGYNSLRGYRERQFRTIQMLRISPEYRFLVSKKSRVYLFYDCAYFETSNYETGEINSYFKDGYGVGSKFSSKIGIISIEYALGEKKTFMKGKIHLGLDTTF